MFKYFLILQLLRVVHGNPIDELPITFEIAKQLESPWLALIKISGLTCGGSLINRQYIVTAAHCFDEINPENLEDENKLKELVQIKLGEWKTDMDPDCEENADDQSCDPVVMIRPKMIVRHDNYKPSRIKEMYKDDIAIIKLAWPPRTTRLISSIRLPSPDECDDLVKDQLWTVTGFGELMQMALNCGFMLSSRSN
ncbi:hypothetical protein ACKWTF_014143 [Chironomus riparius]